MSRSAWQVAAVCVAALALAWLALGAIGWSDGPAWGYDLRAYLDASVRLSETGSPYQAETLDGPYRPGPYGLYMYAPPLAIAVSPMTGLTLDDATIAWFLIHVAALALACAVMPVDVRIRLAVFGIGALSYAVTRDLVLGNVSVLLLLPLAMAWRWLDRSLGSMALGIAMSVRPTLGLLLIWQLLRRQWQAAAWVVGTGVVLVLVTLPFVGLDGYRQFLTVLANMSEVTGVERNFDLASTLLRQGATDTLASATLVAGYIVAVVAMLVSLRRDREVGFMVTLGASLLLSPLLWDHYLAALVLPAAFLAARGRAWGLLLPMLTWLPEAALPFGALAAVLLPFLAREPDDRPAPAEAGTGRHSSTPAVAD
jgi:hypothetical protein